MTCTEKIRRWIIRLLTSPRLQCVATFTCIESFLKASHLASSGTESLNHWMISLANREQVSQHSNCQRDSIRRAAEKQRKKKKTFTLSGNNGALKYFNYQNKWVEYWKVSGQCSENLNQPTCSPTERSIYWLTTSVLQPEITKTFNGHCLWGCEMELHPSGTDPDGLFPLTQCVIFTDKKRIILRNRLYRKVNSETCCFFSWWKLKK